MDNVKLYDLTIPQKSIYLMEQYASGTTINLICGDIVFEQKIKPILVEKALNIYIQKNDSMRMKLCMINGCPKQYISEYKPYNLNIVEVSNNTELETYKKKLISTPIKFFDSDLFSFTLFKIKNEKFVLTTIFHHIISDAWTMSLFAKKFISIYSTLVKGDDLNCSDDFSYIDFINTQNDYINSSRFQKDKEFWNNFFDFEPEPSLISDKKDNIVNYFSHFLICSKIFLT